MIKFRTFKPRTEFVGTHNNRYSATDELNQWIEENPGVEIINWQTCTVGTTEDNELYITIQYWENN